MCVIRAEGCHAKCGDVVDIILLYGATLCWFYVFNEVVFAAPTFDQTYIAFNDSVKMNCKAGRRERPWVLPCGQ